MALINLGVRGGGGGGGGGAATPTVALSPGQAVAEGAGTGAAVTYALTLARNGWAGPVPYSWAVAGSGASPASAGDFAGGVLPGGSGVFGPGETTKSITVPVAGDAAAEPDEGYSLTVSASLPLAPATAAGAILNDDAAPPPALLMGSRYNQMGFNGYQGSDGTDQNGNTRIGSYNETGAAVTRLRAYFANWFANAVNEQDGYNPVTVSASVEYPAGTFTPLLFGGAAAVTIPASGANLAESDEAVLAAPVPAGALY